ncbi:ribonuclease P protein component [Demequina zhanjiangensis]|uniref:Ribonuclease P protein component n=1 Tax=Demequina zhanjiangensis TaxID=3051659 RepID=A0ABT8G413_9MICO|nr:ribonuclease P protein component [Demequina sp. SYSU T00b26]MDN4473881.1 ribonuclease P protein component [Demequina sp. SYSU T00b26]
MLKADSRLRTAADFQSVMRRGSRSGRKTMVVYVERTGDAPSMAGFAVSRAVGVAVVRNRVKRRLRAISAELLPTLPDGTRIVVRALPASASSSFEALRRDLRDGAAAALRKASL